MTSSKHYENDALSQRRELNPMQPGDLAPYLFEGGNVGKPKTCLPRHLHRCWFGLCIPLPASTLFGEYPFAPQTDQALRVPHFALFDASDRGEALVPAKFV